MPVSIATQRDPFRWLNSATTRLSRTHVRILEVLVPANPTDPPSEWPLFTRARIRLKAGFSPRNTLNRALHGDPKDKDRFGLLTLNLIETITIDVAGKLEPAYRITPEGIKCLNARK